MGNFSGPEELYAKIIETLFVETRSNIPSNFLRLNSILVGCALSLQEINRS
jgi:hypothetical protein